MQPSSHYLRCQGREIHYVEWGDKQAPPLVMWHGLARTCRDFDDLAQALCGTYRIIAPDTIGRGYSEWSPVPEQEYCLAFYAEIAQSLLDQLGIEQARWVGTSMGGAIGTRAAATTLKGRISHLVLNDNGPMLALGALERIKAYAGSPPEFDTVSQLETYLRKIYLPYGWQSDAQWRRMTETSTRRLPSGKITTHYDPNMVRQFFDHPNDYRTWEFYDQLTMPTLVLRGENSDLLQQVVVDEMQTRGPRAQVAIIPDCGHAPCMNVPDQIDIVRQFLAN